MSLKGQQINRILKTGVLAFALLSISALGAEEVRTFSDMKGRSFEGKLIDFDATTQVVTIQRADGKTGKMKLSRFSEADRMYIRDWGVENDFMNGMKVSVKLQSESISAKDSGFSDVSKKVWDYRYQILLENGSSSAIGKVDIEYCIFYRQGERDGSIINYDEGICYGCTTGESLKPESTTVFETKKIRLHFEGGHQTLFGAIEHSTAGIRGIWLRLRTVLPSGGEIVREYRTSDDDYWKWSDFSIGAGVNKGDNTYRLILK